MLRLISDRGEDPQLEGDPLLPNERFCTTVRGM